MGLGGLGVHVLAGCGAAVADKAFTGTNKAVAAISSCKVVKKK